MGGPEATPALPPRFPSHRRAGARYICMEEAMKAALSEYGRRIRDDGWEAGEPLVDKYSLQFKDFGKWSRGLAIALRARELLEEDGRVAKR